MTATLISLISIFSGLLGANIFATLYKRYSFGLTGNTIAGVFGSIFLIKFFGRLGFRPNDIVVNGEFFINPFLINIFFSVLGSVLALILLKKLRLKLELN